jgi:hypothetical protein
MVGWKIFRKNGVMGELRKDVYWKGTGEWRKHLMKRGESS